MSDLDQLDLLSDYDKDDGQDLSRFISKPTQRKYQPFGGPIPQAATPQPQPIDYQGEALAQETPYIGKQAPYSPFDELDQYEQLKDQYSTFSRESTAYNAWAANGRKMYDDFRDGELMPFYDQFGLHGEHEDDNGFIDELDLLYKGYEKAAQQEDGFFGPSEDKLAAIENIKKFGSWGGSNGLRERYRKLREEKDKRDALAEQMSQSKAQALEGMISLPMEDRVRMDERIAAKKRSPRSKKVTNELLDQYEFEAPQIDIGTGEVLNIDRIDPREKVRGFDIGTGESLKSVKRQKERMTAALKGDIEGFLESRPAIDKARRLRDGGYMVGHPGGIRGLGRSDQDLFEVGRMKEAGFTEFKGVPIDEAISKLGGEEKLQMTKILAAAFEARDLHRKAQLDFLKVAGGGKGHKEAKARMEQTRDSWHKAVAMAGQFGLTSRLYEQMESREDEVGFWEGIGNAFDRGLKMADQASLTDELALNRVGESTIQQLIQVSQEIEDLPGSSALQRYQKSAGKSKGPIEAIGNILFDHPDAIPELITETLFAFLPAYFETAKVALPVAVAAGPLVQKLSKHPIGLATSLGLGLRLNAGLASFTLEFVGKITEEMGKLGVDWQDPHIFAAAWQNDAIRNKLVKKAGLKAGTIGLLDAASGMIAGRVRQTAGYLGMKGGKLTNAEQWAKAGADVPVFTKWQRARGALAEAGAGAGLGMSGELLGQLASREPGEALDYDSIAAEGVIDLASPFSIYGAGREVFTKPDNVDFSKASMNFTNDQPYMVNGAQVGTTGKVTRAGMENTWHSFDSSDGMTAHLLEKSGIPFDSEQGKWLQTTLMQLQKVDSQKFKNIRLVFGSRTPDSVDQGGLFEYDSESGAYLLSFNREKFKQDPVGTFMHEAGHFARRAIFKKNGEFYELYNNLGPQLQLDAWAEYVLKRPELKFNQIKDAKQKQEVLDLFHKTDQATKADEWFSMQFARILAGRKADKSIAKPLEDFLEQFIRPAMMGWMGSDAVKDTSMDALVLEKMGWGPNGTRMGDTIKDMDFEAPGVRAAAYPDELSGLSKQEGIKYLMDAISQYDAQTQKEILNTLDAIMGDRFFTPMATAFASEKITEAEAQEFADPEAAKDFSKKKVDLARAVQEGGSAMVDAEITELNKLDASAAPREEDAAQNKEVTGILRELESLITSPSKLKEKVTKARNARVKELMDADKVDYENMDPKEKNKTWDRYVKKVSLVSVIGDIVQIEKLTQASRGGSSKFGTNLIETLIKKVPNLNDIRNELFLGAQNRDDTFEKIQSEKQAAISEFARVEKKLKEYKKAFPGSDKNKKQAAKPKKQLVMYKTSSVKTENGRSYIRIDVKKSTPVKNPKAFKVFNTLEEVLSAIEKVKPKAKQSKLADYLDMLIDNSLLRDKESGFKLALVGKKESLKIVVVGYRNQQQQAPKETVKKLPEPDRKAIRNAIIITFSKRAQEFPEFKGMSKREAQLAYARASLDYNFRNKEYEAFYKQNGFSRNFTQAFLSALSEGPDGKELTPRQLFRFIERGIPDFTEDKPSLDSIPHQKITKFRKKLDSLTEAEKGEKKDGKYQPPPRDTTTIDSVYAQWGATLNLLKSAMPSEDAKSVEKLAGRISQAMSNPKAFKEFSQDKEGRLKELQRKIDLLTEAEMLFAPEDYKIMWANTPINFGVYAGGFNRERDGSLVPITLGLIAERSEKGGTLQVYDKNGRKKSEVLNPQSTLEKLYRDFNMKPSIKGKKVDPDEPYTKFGNRSHRQMKMALAAAYSSAHTQPRGKGIKSNISRDSILQYTSDQGTSVIKTVAHLIFELNKQSLDSPQVQEDGSTKSRQKMLVFNDKRTAHEALLAELVDLSNITGSEDTDVSARMQWLMYQKSKYFAEALKEALAEGPKKAETDAEFAKRKSSYPQITKKLPAETQELFDARVESYKKAITALISFERTSGNEVGSVSVRYLDPTIPQQLKELKFRYDARKKTKRTADGVSEVQDADISFRDWIDVTNKKGEFINRRDVIETGIPSQGAQTEQTTVSAMGVSGRLWTSETLNMAPFEWDFQRAEMIQTILDTWKSDIDLSSENIGFSNSFRDFFETFETPKSEQIFVDNLLKRKYTAETGKQPREDWEAYNKWEKKNQYPEIPRESDELAKLQKERSDVYRDVGTRAALKEVDDKIAVEREKIRVKAVAARSKIFEDFEKLEMEGVKKKKNKKMARAFIEASRSRFVHQKAVFSKDGKTIEYDTPYRVRQPEQRDRNKYRLPNNFRIDDYEFIEDFDAILNPEDTVKAQDGVHGEFKLGQTHKPYDLLRLYLRQAKKVFSELSPSEEKGVGVDKYGREYQIPDSRARRPDGTFMPDSERFFRVLRLREQLNSQFARAYAQEGEVLKFTALDRSGKQINILAKYEGSSWVHMDTGKELSDVSTESEDGGSIRPSVLDQANAAFLDRQDKLGDEARDAFTSDMHMNAVRLARQLIGQGLSSLTHFPDATARQPGSTPASDRPGSPFAPYLLQRILHPLISQIYKDLKIDTSATVTINKEKYTLEDLLDEINPISHIESKEEASETVDENPPVKPSEVRLDGGGLSNVVQEWFEEAGLSDNQFSGNKLDDREEIEPATTITLESGKKKKVAAKFESDEDIDVSNVANSDVTIIFRASKGGSKRQDTVKKYVKADEKDFIFVDLWDKDLSLRKLYKEFRKKVGAYTDEDGVEVTDPKSKGISTYFHFPKDLSDKHTDKVKSVLNAFYNGELPPEAKPEEKTPKSKDKGQKPKGKVTEIHFEKGKNPYLSNFQTLRRGLEYNGKTFYSVEAAYQAYKDPKKAKDKKYVKLFTDSGLTGKEAQKLAKDEGAQVDQSSNVDLMRELIGLRFKTDRKFREDLKKANNLKHTVSDKFWSEKYVELLNELKTENWFEDSELWGDESINPQSNRGKMMERLMDPIVIALLNARRLDIFQQSEAKDEVLTRAIYDDEVVSLDDAISASVVGAEKTEDNSEIPEGVDANTEWEDDLSTASNPNVDVNLVSENLREEVAEAEEAENRDEARDVIADAKQAIGSEIVKVLTSRREGMPEFKQRVKDTDNPDMYATFAIARLLADTQPNGSKGNPALRFIFDGQLNIDEPPEFTGVITAEYIEDLKNWAEDVGQRDDNNYELFRTVFFNPFSIGKQSLREFTSGLRKKYGTEPNPDAKSVSFPKPDPSKLGSTPLLLNNKKGAARFLELLKPGSGAYNEIKDTAIDSIKEDFSAPGGFKDRVILDYVDKFRPIKNMFYNVQKMFGPEFAKGTPLYDSLNAWGKIHTYLGIGYNEIEQNRVNFREPFMEAMRDSEVDPNDVGAYFQARMAPSRNIHHSKQIEDALQEIQSDKDTPERDKRYKELKEQARRKDLSGMSNDTAISIVKDLENDEKFSKFLAHKNNPLKIWYDMGMADMDNRSQSGLIDPEERGRMISAASYFDWSKHGSKYMYKKGGKTLKYSYAPLQGFEGEFQNMVDSERSWELLGQASKAAGKGFDQPKVKFLQKGAYGRAGGVLGADPEIAWGVHEQQLMDGALRGHKNTVSQAFGDMHDMMRRIAYGEEEGTRIPDKFRGLDLDALHKDENFREKVKKEYDRYFKSHITEVPKKEYEWVDVIPNDENGRPVPRLKVVQKKISTTFKDDPHVFVFRKNGVPHYVEFQKNPDGTLLASSLKNMRYESLPELMQYMNTTTRLMSQAFTSRNPSFMIPNFGRDYLGAMINLGEDDKRVLIPDALSPRNIKKFGSAIMKAEVSLKVKNKNPITVNEFKGGGKKMAMQLLEEDDPVKMYMFAKNNGALVGYTRYASVPELVKNMVKDTDPKAKDGGLNWFKNTAIPYMDALNAVAENSIRISSFWAAIKDGRSVQEAALISRNVTVDFNQGGNNSTAMNSMYMFFRAATNGIDRAYRAIMNRSPRERLKLVTQIASVSYTTATLARLLDDDYDEETEPVYDQVHSYLRYRQMIIPVPGWLLESVGLKDEGAHIRVPLPLGLGTSIWGVGQYLADLTAYYSPYGFMRGGQGMVGATRSLGSSMMDLTNPFGSGDILSLITPSVATPFMELRANKDFMGRAIVREKMVWEHSKPAHKMDPSRTPEIYTQLSAAVNRALGGSDETIGSLRGIFQNPLHFSDDEDWKWDWSGNQIRHLLHGFLGGPMMDAEGLVSTVASAVSSKKEFDLREVPVLRRFLRGTTYGGNTRTKMFNLKDAVHQAEKHVEKASSPGEKLRRKKEQKLLLSFSKDIDQYDRLKNKTTDVINKINASNRPEFEKAQLVADYEAKLLEHMTKVINRAQKQGLSMR